MKKWISLSIILLILTSCAVIHVDDHMPYPTTEKEREMMKRVNFSHFYLQAHDVTVLYGKAFCKGFRNYRKEYKRIFDEKFDFHYFLYFGMHEDYDNHKKMKKQFRRECK